MPGELPPLDAPLQETTSRGSGSAADAAAAAYTKRPPPPLPLPPGVTFQELRSTLRPAQRRDVQRAVDDMEKSMRTTSGLHHVKPTRSSEGRWTPQGVPGTAEPENVVDNGARASSCSVPTTCAAPTSDSEEHSSLTKTAAGRQRLETVSTGSIGVDETGHHGEQSENSRDHEVADEMPHRAKGQPFADAADAALKSALLPGSITEENRSSVHPASDGPRLESVFEAREATIDVSATTPSNSAQEPPAILVDPVSTDAPYLWEAQSDATIASQLTSVITDMNSLSAECDRLFQSLQCESVDAEQLHEVTQRLVDRFGCRNPEALEKIGTIYAAAAIPKGGASAAGMGSLEFRGYVAAVLNQVLKDLESREEEKPQEAQPEAVAANHESDLDDLNGMVGDLQSFFSNFSANFSQQR